MIQQTQTRPVTLADITALDPRIGALLNEATIPTDIPFWHRYSHYKRLLSQHVGNDASVPELATQAAYECVIRALEMALPEEPEVQE